MKYKITKSKISFVNNKWIYECSDGKTIYKRPLGKDGPKYLVIGFKYPGIPNACLN